MQGLLTYLIPRHIEEGKSYLTIAFGCTSGKHRSVMMAEWLKKALEKHGSRCASPTATLISS